MIKNYVFLRRLVSFFMAKVRKLLDLKIRFPTEFGNLVKELKSSAMASFSDLKTMREKVRNFAAQTGKSL